ncbi:MAG: Ig-like domain-containing protein, partial [Gammaproteobacteria bacterium]|nr:Ig-like domain-containing protein [Gammaproteobacteria bacterium]
MKGISKLALPAVVGLLTACSGGSGSSDGGAASEKISGKVVKGPVASAQITATPISPYTAAPLSEPTPLGQTNADGSFSGDLGQIGAETPVLIESFGGSFIDESDPNSDGGERRQIDVDGESGLFIYRPAGIENVSITLLSDSISVRALQMAQQQQISVDNAYQALREQATSILGFDPLTTNAVDPISPPAEATPDEKRYALLIGSLAVVANEVAIRVGLGQMNTEVISAVLQDLADGVVDGRSGNNVIQVNEQPMPDIDWHAAIQRFRNNNDAAYQDVTPPTPNEAAWAETPQPTNSAPTVSIVNNQLFLAVGQTLALDSSVITVDDAETPTENLGFVLLAPTNFGAVGEGEEPLFPNHPPVSRLVYNNFESGEGQLENITFGVVDEDNGIGFANLQVQINQLPNAVPDQGSLNEDQSTLFDVLANDSDADEHQLTITSITPISPEGSQLTIENGAVRVIPPSDFSGTIEFDYTISDGFNPAATNVVLTVNPVNDAPNAVDDVAATPEDTPVNIDVLANDTDAENDPLTIVGDTLSASSGSVSISNNQLVFTPAANFNGTATINYEATDGNGGFGAATVTVTVNPVNDAPVVQDGIPDQTVNEEQFLNFTFSATAFSDADGDTLTYSATDGPSAPLPAWLTFDAANRNFSGTPDDADLPGLSVVVTADDGNGESTDTIFNINVNPVNDRPVAQDDVATTDEDTQVNIDVLANDSDADGDPLTIQGDTLSATNGSVSISNDQLVFTPAADFNGTATINYEATDGNGGFGAATVTVTVNPVNDAPVVQDGIPDQTVNEEQFLNFTFSATAFNDADGDALTYSATDGDTNPLPAWLSFDAVNRNFSGTPDDADLPGLAVVVTADDGNGGNENITFNITVNPVNDRPVAQDDVATTDEDTQVNIDVLANDSDADGDPLTIQGDTLSATNGSVSISNDQLVFTPAADFNGTATINYEATDGNGGFGAATVTVTVNAVNDAPVVQDGIPDQTVNEEQFLNFTFSTTAFSDADGDALTYSATDVDTNPLPAWLSFDAVNRNFSGTPDDTDLPGLAVIVTADDGNGGNENITFNINVNPVNDRPVAQDDVASTDEDTQVNIDVLANDSDADGDPLTIQGDTLSATNRSGSISNNQ